MLLPKGSKGLTKTSLLSLSLNLPCRRALTSFELRNVVKGGSGQNRVVSWMFGMVDKNKTVC